ncbi:MAG: 6-hydroxymethylpterin diphosphokinase MptE-like protein [Spirochaetota bacterium]
MNQAIYTSNLTKLSKQDAARLEETAILGEVQKAKRDGYTLVIDGIYFHSKHNPQKEAERLIADLQDDTKNERLFLFFGAGLGYSVLQALQNKNCRVIWLERNTGIAKAALSVLDFSQYFENNRLQLLLGDFGEEEMFLKFKGTAKLSVTFITHRASVTWKEEQYLQLKFICEQFFHKKDVNVATLAKFEKIWIRNMLHNLPELLSMAPMSLLFDCAQGLPIVVVAAGPSLSESLADIRKYRDCFLLITVDTALHVLTHGGIEPDLIYSVDPQAINSAYLQGYSGDALLAFDPTSTYHTLRLRSPVQGFFSASPFPLLNLLLKRMHIHPGDVPFGGSVSTNALSLADLMGAAKSYLVGQDLAFTDGLAHSKGAILEERLNFKETRYFRRELHNHRQLSYLQKIPISGYTGEQYITNEKMQIFRKWFETHPNCQNWTNLTAKGGIIENIPRSDFSSSFAATTEEEKAKVQACREKIRFLSEPRGQNHSYKYIDVAMLQTDIQDLLQQLTTFTETLQRGSSISQEIYEMLAKGNEQKKRFMQNLQTMESLDEIVANKKGLNEILAGSIQRIIYSITEGYGENLNPQEKLNEKLAIAKKSVLLYKGLLDSCNLHKKLLKKALYRLQTEGIT